MGFAVVQDRARLRRYSDRAKALLLEGLASDAKAGAYADLLKSESYDIFYDAGTLVVICATAQGPYTDADCWLAAENLMLAACALGLGTCPIGFALMVLNAPDVKRELGIPEAGSAVAPIIVGYPEGSGEPRPRNAPKILSWLR